MDHLVVSPPAYDRKSCVQGSITYQFTTRSGHTSTRFLQKTYAQVTKARQDAAWEAAGMQGAYQVRLRAKGQSVPSPRLRPFLPRALVAA